jgi:heat-inducible transcriptional repressor
MIPRRTGKILNTIVEYYIARAAPVPSQVIANAAGLKVSPATIRNEMACLEQEGYLIRPHTSSGCVPSDKGYRYYVESLKDLKLPQTEERLISHLFHQVEEEVEAWLNLTATILARLSQNVAVVSLPKAADCKLKHMELVSLQDTVALAVIVLYGAKVKQKLINFNEIVSQGALTAASMKLNGLYSGLTGQQISSVAADLSSVEKLVTANLLESMKSEDTQEFEEPHLEGWHFMLNQPEFAQSDSMLTLMELVEHRNLLKAIIPAELTGHEVHVSIGEENTTKAIQNCSIVISRYGIPGEATGAVGVVGPTRMPYPHTMSIVSYMSSVLSELIAGLYGRHINGN